MYCVSSLFLLPTGTGPVVVDVPASSKLDCFWIGLLTPLDY